MLPAETVTSAPRSGQTGRHGVVSSREDGPRCVVLDTNTVLDWLVFRDPPACGVGAAITGGRLRWLASPRMVAELRAVLCRPLASRWEVAREQALTTDTAQWTSPCAEPSI